MKHCGKCGQGKPYDAFNKNKSSKDGLGVWCRDCSKAYGKTYAKEHSAEAVARAGVWSKANPERAKAIQVSYSIRNRYEIAARRAANRDEVNERARKAAAYIANADALKKRQCAYRVLNHEKVMANVRMDKARRKGAEGFFTSDDVRAIMESQAYLCANRYCCADLRVVAKHLDHKHPVSRGGSNWPTNLQWLCGPCNLHKRARTNEEWLASLEVSRANHGKDTHAA